MTSQKLKLIFATTLALLLETMAPTLIQVANAAQAPQFTETFVRLDRHKALTPTGVMVCAKPSAASTTATEADVKITFPTDQAAGGTNFVVNATAANWTVDTTNLPTEPGSTGPSVGATAWPGIGTATAVSGHTVTFPSADLTAGTLYCFHISGTNTLTNSTAASGNNIISATVFTEATGPTTINQTNWSTSVISDDQIVVSAVVPPSFSISLSGNTDPFTQNLDPATIISTAGRTVSITTNAVGGWIAWVKDSQQGLYSASAAYKINTSGVIDAAPTTLVANGTTEGYGLAVNLTTANVGGCTNVIDPEYKPGVSGTDLDKVGTLSANFQPIATCTRQSAGPGTSDGDVLTLIERATIRGGTPAGSDYSDILTVVGAGNF